MTETIINAVARRVGHDLFIDSTRSTEACTDGTAFKSLPAFGVVTTRDGIEVWELGLHIVVSRLRTPRGGSVHPQAI